MSPPHQILQAWLNSPTSGVVELTQDWRAKNPPPAKFSGDLATSPLRRMPEHAFGYASGYYVTRQDRLVFFLDAKSHPELFHHQAEVFVVGDFNQWAPDDDWRLRTGTIGPETVLRWEGEAASLLADPPVRFKFVTAGGRWLEVPSEAPNALVDEDGNHNRIIDPARTGQHLFRFDLAEPIDLSRSWWVHWPEGDEPQSVLLRPGRFLHDMATDLPLGANQEGAHTAFRLFAPRASRVELVLEGDDGRQERFKLSRRSQGSLGDRAVWELALEGELVGWRYSYRIDGPRDELGWYDPEQMILDPYAQAACTRQGPGIVVAREPHEDDGFVPPAWQDLVICEAHVRDLVALAPVDLAPDERRGFRGLQKWVDSPDFYLDRLGVNCVELQPVQEFDNETVEEYHWGYMTTNFFAPDSSYATAAQAASGVREMRDLVAAFHRRGIAVILDVVYNHVGVPGHLLFIDKLYYFAVGRGGELSNWSGCGNDLKADAAMAKRLIIDSCTHLIRCYQVDGFRFDLAELLGVGVLEEIESRLKAVKPDVILIAEPWSYRGHIAGALAETGWASWNDGYRGFLKEYVHGGGTQEAFEYYLKGSPWYFARWPAQTVNYVESHDDRTWIDEITENVDGNGHLPTANDRRRTHLMATVLFSSIGIPMISAGQDFLRSKFGVTNTYQRGDLNVLDYRRLERFSGTHAYFAAWIAFRRSPAGELFRHYSRASETFFRFWFASSSNAAAVLYNADRSMGSHQLLLAINPTLFDTEVPIDVEVAADSWVRVADHERFMSSSRPLPPRSLPASIWLPALGCGLWSHAA